VRRRAAWLVLLAALAPAAAYALDPGRPAPPFTLKDQAGKPVRLADHRGSVVLVNFWATWCKPCREELPRLEALYRRYRAEGFVILAVNLDTARNAGKARALRERLGLSFPVLYDPNQAVPSLYELAKMPSSFLIDRRGIVRYVHAGFEAKDEAKIEAMVKRELSRSAPRGTRPSASE
jgi:peroxiredoxin